MKMPAFVTKRKYKHQTTGVFSSVRDASYKIMASSFGRGKKLFPASN